MVKRFTLLFSLIMSICTGAFADDYVANVTVGSATTGYATIADALTAANAAQAEATITMLGNETSDATTLYVTNNNGVIFEGGDYTLTVPMGIGVINGGKLTINSGNINYTGKGNAITLIASTLTVNGGTVDATTNADSEGIFITTNTEILNINGGTIKAGHDAVYIASATDYPLSNMSIKGGTFVPGELYVPIGFDKDPVTDYIRNLIPKYYNFYTADDGTVINANQSNFDQGVAVTVKPVTNVTCNSVNYMVTTLNETLNMYNATATGYDGDMLTNTTITFPDTFTDPDNQNNQFVVTGIGANAFENQTSLVGVTFGQYVTSIGDYAFCFTDIAELTIPEDVESIGVKAFANNPFLTTINYNAKNVKGTYTEATRPFFNADPYVNLNIGAAVESIPDYMFYYVSLSGEDTGVPGTITADPVSAPAIGDNTFYSDVKAAVTLKTPNVTNVTCKTYEAWGFAKYTLPTFTSLVLSDEAPTLYPGNYDCYAITYTRTTKCNNYATFCLPFDYTYGNQDFQKAWIPTNVALVQNDMICLLFKETSSSSIPAYTPFIGLCASTQNSVFQNDNAVAFTGSETNPDAQTIDLFDFNGTGNMFQNNDYTVTYGGTILGKEWQTGLYQFNADGTIQQRDESAGALIPFRAYVTKTAKTYDAKAMPIVAILEGQDGTVTTVGKIDNGEFKTDNTAIYNLAGQKINTMQHGINIINGKKIMVE